ncbi:MAG: hypothetical protein H0U19_02880 [Acidobacteria bacterium]|nr:hypothetical protein [Acidobacteriota bacterium]
MRRLVPSLVALVLLATTATVAAEQAAAPRGGAKLRDARDRLGDEAP